MRTDTGYVTLSFIINNSRYYSLQQAIGAFITTIYSTEIDQLISDTRITLQDSMDSLGRGSFLSNIDYNGFRVINLKLPTNNQDIANKQYVVNKVASVLAPPSTPTGTETKLLYAKPDRTLGFETLAYLFNNDAALSFGRLNGSIFTGTLTSALTAINTLDNRVLASNSITNNKFRTGAITQDRLATNNLYNSTTTRNKTYKVYNKGMFIVDLSGNGGFTYLYGGKWSTPTITGTTPSTRAYMTSADGFIAGGENGSTIFNDIYSVSETSNGVNISQSPITGFPSLKGITGALLSGYGVFSGTEVLTFYGGVNSSSVYSNILYYINLAFINEGSINLTPIVFTGAPAVAYAATAPVYQGGVRQNSLLVFGGETASNTYSNRLFQFSNINYSSGSLTELTPATSPSARSRTKLTYYKGNYYMFGGLTASGAVYDCWKYNLTSNTWTKLFESVGAITTNTATQYLIDNYLFIVTGQGVSAGTFVIAINLDDPTGQLDVYITSGTNPTVGYNGATPLQFTDSTGNVNCYQFGGVNSTTYNNTIRRFAFNPRALT